jgi:hypothetical protein
MRLKDRGCNVKRPRADGIYGRDNHHSGLGYLTPEQVHTGRTEEILQAREQVMMQAWNAHPERFVNGMPRISRPPLEVWINPPKGESASVAINREETQLIRH